MMYDDFDTEIQSDEIVPEEYEDWLRYCATGVSEVTQDDVD